MFFVIMQRLWKSISFLQFVVKFFWLLSLSLNFIFSVGGISLFFVSLTTLLILLCLLTNWNSINENLEKFLPAFLLLNFFLIGTFCILDLLFFYIFFESVLIPSMRLIKISMSCLWSNVQNCILQILNFSFCE